MVLTREQVVQDINSLSDPAFQRVAEFIAFIKFQERRSDIPIFDEVEMAELYADAGEEDVEFAEDGMEDYAIGLAAEDKL